MFCWNFGGAWLYWLYKFNTYIYIQSYIYICIPILSTIVVCIFSKVIKLKEPIMTSHKSMCICALLNLEILTIITLQETRKTISHQTGKGTTSWYPFNPTGVSLQPYRGIPSTLQGYPFNPTGVDVGHKFLVGLFPSTTPVQVGDWCFRMILAHPVRLVANMIKYVTSKLRQ